MATTIRMLAPATAGNVITGMPSGTIYYPDNFGGINVTALSDIPAFVAQGWQIQTGLPTMANFRNLVDGGDATTNPWQRGTSFTGIANTLTYTADRFFAVGGATSSISVSQVASTALLGFSSAFQFGRASATTDTTPIYFGQVVETADSIRMQGQWVTVSFYVAAGANFSSANSDLSVSLIWSTGTNQSAANMVAGSWTGQAQVPLTANQPVGTGGANGTASAAAVQQINASPTRYSWTGLVPSSAAQIGLLLSYTPVGTAGSADYIQIYGIQIEPGTVAGPFEHRDVQVELEIAQRYAFVANEPANGVALTTGMNTGASSQQFFIPLPVQMLKAPTVTVVGSSPAWKTNQAGVATATTLVAGGTHTVNAITLTSNSAGTAGQATMLQGGGGNGRIVVSADL